MKNLARAILAIMLACSLPTAGVQAQTLIAPGDVTALITAINQANANGVPTILNLSAGAYSLISADNTRWEGPNGLPPITGDITINGVIADKAADGTVITRSSTAPEFRIFSVIGGKLTLNNLTISGGLRQTGSGVGGGALFNGGGTVTIVASAISDNQAIDGGGILNYFGTLNVVNSTLSANAALDSGGNGGGGILSFAARTNVASSTIANNSAAQGRGDSIADAFSPPGFFRIKNSILAGTATGNDCHGLAGGILVSFGRNRAQDNSCAASLTDPGDLNNVDPKLGALADNGGPTRTHALLPFSPAVDIIPLTACTDLDGASITRDQRGKTRPLSQAQVNLCDSGAVERVPITLIATIPVEKAMAIAVDPGIDKVFVTSPRNSPPEHLVVISEQHLAVVDKIDVAATRTDSWQVAVDTQTNRVFVANFFSPYTVTGFAYDAATLSHARYAASPGLGVHPIGLAVDSQTSRVYVLSSWHGNVTVLNGSPNLSTLPKLTPPNTPIPFPPPASHSYPAAAIDLQTRRVYFTDWLNGRLGVMDASGGVPTSFSGTMPVGLNPRAVAINHKTGIAYVANNPQPTGPWNVTAVNLATQATVTIGVGPYPWNLAVNPETNRIYVVASGYNQLKVIDGSTNLVIAVLPTGATGAGAVAVNPQRNRAYVANSGTAIPGSGFVTVFDLGDP